MFELTPYRHLHPPHLTGSFRSSRGEFQLIALGDGGTRFGGPHLVSARHRTARLLAALDRSNCSSHSPSRVASHQEGGGGVNLVSPSTAVPSWRPFARLDLTINPFGELTPEQRGEVAVVDVEWWTAWLTAGRAAGKLRAVQFMGDCGRGKTTHLLALRFALPTAKYVYLPQHGPLPATPEGPLVMIDEAQRLSWRRRREIFNRGRGAAVGVCAGHPPRLARLAPPRGLRSANAGSRPLDGRGASSRHHERSD